LFQLMATVLAYKTSLLLLLALSGGSVAGMTYYYQGQTANLNNEINNLGNGITSSNGQIANLTSQISKLKAEIASLNQSLQTLPLVNEVPRNVAIRVEWVNTFNSNQDRFYPEYITVAQGDNLSLVFISNDTSDAHTFTISLSFRGLPVAAFQLNNSWTGLSSGPFLIPANTNFTGRPTGCTDQNGDSVTCSTQKADSGTGSTGDCNNTAAIPLQCDLWSTGELGLVTVPGVYKFFDFYHQTIGMYGWLIVLPNKGYSAG